MAASPTFPRVHAMVICDLIEQREEPEVYDLLGVRMEIRASGFPHDQPLLFVYAQVGGRQGVVNCHVEVIHPDLDEPLQVTPIREVQLLGPLQPVPVDFGIEDCTFPHAGVYYIQIFFDAKLSGERLLVLSADEELRNGQESP